MFNYRPIADALTQGIAAVSRRRRLLSRDRFVSVVAASTRMRHLLLFRADSRR
jgi:hypothetical protein